MKKAAIEFLALVSLFFLTWFAFSRIDWLTVFPVKKAGKTTEEKLGKLYWQFFRKTGTEVQAQVITGAVDSLVAHLCQRNGIDRAGIKVHILQKEQVNAFTLPDNHLVVYTGLLTAAENEAELLGVLGHEIAHMEKEHVMKKLVKEVGLSVLLAMTTGNGNGEIVQSSARILSGSAYDRNLEREADLAATDYLLQAGIDPEPFAQFLYRLSERQPRVAGQVYWISTHPDSKERAEQILTYARGRKIKKRPVLRQATWQRLQAKLNPRS